MSSGERKDGTTLARPTLVPLLAGFAAGFTAAAAVCVGVGWLNRTPSAPLADDFSSLTSMLWRTTCVVAGAAVLVAVFLGVGRVFRNSLPVKKFAAFTSPVLVVIAVAAGKAHSIGGAAQAFTSAGAAQVALHPFAVTTVANAAWWLACLAVAALALTCCIDYAEARAEVTPPRPVRWVAPGVAAAVVVVSVLSVVLWAKKSPFKGETAERTDVETLTELHGEVAYRAQMSTSVTDAHPAGAGWVSVVGDRDGSRIEGFDGATGQRRWWFGVDELRVSGIQSSGTGPASVVLVRSYAPTDSLLALDATTGALLWARPDHHAFGEGFPASGSVVLLKSEEPDGGTSWQAVSLRTGEDLWSKVFRRDCGTTFVATASTVLMSTCDDGPGLAAQVLDPQTGERLRTLSSESLGVTDELTVGASRGDHVLMSGKSGGIIVDVHSGRTTARLPNHDSAAFIDAESLVLTRPVDRLDELKSVSIFDLRDGHVIDSGLVESWRSDDPGWQTIVKVGDEWVTLLQDEQSIARVRSESNATVQPPEMRVITKSGEMHTIPNPCEHFESIPVVSPVPGAVLVACKTNPGEAVGVH